MASLLRTLSNLPLTHVTPGAWCGPTSPSRDNKGSRGHERWHREPPEQADPRGSGGLARPGYRAVIARQDSGVYRRPDGATLIFSVWRCLHEFVLLAQFGEG